MKRLASFVISAIAATWLGASAILAIQNYTPVSLRFLNYQSIEMPLGLVLSFSVGLGMLGMALLTPLLGLSSHATEEQE